MAKLHMFKVSKLIQATGQLHINNRGNYSVFNRWKLEKRRILQ
jgi:hypothetical protein